jgi:predicted membrane protein
MDNNDKPISRSNSRVWVALTLMVVGGALFLQQLGIPLPYWLFSWQMLLITIGVIMGFNHGFRGGAWAIMILIGGVFLVDDILPGFSFHRFMWPFAILIVGLLLLVRPRRRWDSRWDDWKKNIKEPGHWKKEYEQYKDQYGNFTSENYIDATTVFGGLHKTIVSKDFKGGDITIFMGGAEINLSQADINGVAVLDITQVMGGTKLIVPPHWEIRSQMTSVFGNIEDKRQDSKNSNPEKVLIVDGTSVFGGIEIRNY